MGKIEKVSVALTEELAAAVRAAVASGDYGSASEVVREALRLWRDRRAGERGEAAWLRLLWEEGVASGPGRLGSIDDILAEARRRYDAARS